MLKNGGPTEIFSPVTVVRCDQAAIGDGDAMRVAREVRENGLSRG
jgi:hypothetical protein